MTALAELYAQHGFWVWTGLAAALLTAEVVTGSGWLLWAAASAAIVALATPLLGLAPWMAVLAFALLTLASSLLARRYLPRSMIGAGGDINDNVGRLIGRRGVASHPFEGRQGRVAIDGKEWAAELESETTVLLAGAEVEVVSVDGARLKVRAA